MKSPIPLDTPGTLMAEADMEPREALLNSLRKARSDFHNACEEVTRQERNRSLAERKIIRLMEALETLYPNFEIPGSE